MYFPKEEIRIRHDDAEMLTVYCGAQEVAWAQWSNLYKLWRVLILRDKHLYHLKNIDEIISICCDEIGVDNKTETN